MFAETIDGEARPEQGAVPVIWAKMEDLPGCAIRGLQAVMVQTEVFVMKTTGDGVVGESATPLYVQPWRNETVNDTSTDVTGS